MRKHVIGFLAVAVAAALWCVPLAQPASAAAAKLGDKAHDVAHGGDLRSVRVANTARALWVTVRTRDLVPEPASGIGGAVFLDTDGRPGPDFVLVAGLFDGTDYALLRTDSWRLRRAVERVDCSYRMRLDYAEDTAKLRIANRCFAAAPGSGAVRVEVRTSAAPGEGVDWLGAARKLSRAVPRG